MMYDLARIRYVTKHYRDLQGLSLLPLSLWLLASAGYDLGWLKFPGWLADELLLFPMSWAFTMMSIWLIGKVYDRTFGWIAVEQEPKASRRAAYGWVAVIIAVIFLQDALPWASFFGLVGTGFSLYAWFRLGRREARHYLVFGTLLATMSLAPLLDGSLYPSVTARDVAIKLVAAMGIVVVGTIDHLTLVRTLGPVRQEEESRARSI